MVFGLYLVGILFLILPVLLINFIKGMREFSSWNIEICNFNKILVSIILLIVVVISIIQTNFHTIQLLCIPLLAIVFFKKDIAELNKNIGLLEIISIYTFSFLLFYFAFGFPQTDSDINVFYDFHYYAKLSQKIMNGQCEHGAALLSSYTNNKGISLYHFSDLWFTGFFSELLRLSHISVLSFFTYPLLLTMGIFSLKEFLLQIGNEFSSLKSYLIVVIVMFGFSFPVSLIQSNFLELSYFRYVYVPGFDFYSTKTLILLPLITLSMSSLIRKDFIRFVSFILLATITYSTTLIFFTCILFFVLLYKLRVDIKLKNLNNRTNYYIAILIGGFYVSLLLMLINWVDFPVLPSSSIELSLKSIIVLFVEYNLSPLIVYCIPLLFIFTIKSREKRWFAIKLSSLLILSISITSIYVIKKTGNQNVAQALINSVPFIFLVLTLYVFQSNEKVYKNILVVIFSFSAVYNFSSHSLVNGSYNEDEKKIQALLQNEEGLKKWAVIDSCLTENKFYKFNQLGYFLYYNQNLDYPVDLSNFFSLDAAEINKLPVINTGLLEQEWINRKNEQKEHIFLNFIRTNGISYVLSRNKSANGLLYQFSMKEKLVLLKYSNNGLMLWKVV